MTIADAVGWAGAGCLLLAYAALSRGRLAIGVRYHLMNLAGAGGLAINGAVHHAWPSTVLNLIWLGIGLAALRPAKTKTGIRPLVSDSTRRRAPVVRVGSASECDPSRPAAP